MTNTPKYAVLTTGPKCHYVTNNGQIVAPGFKSKRAAQAHADAQNAEEGTR